MRGKARREDGEREGWDRGRPGIEDGEREGWDRGW